MGKAGIVLALPLLLLASCSDKQSSCREVPSLEKDPTPIAIHAMETEMGAINDGAQALAFLNKHPQLANEYFRRQEVESDTILSNDLVKTYHGSPYMDTLLQDVAKRYKGFDDTLSSELGKALSHIKQAYPDFNIPNVYTVTTGFRNDLVVNDSVIIIGREFFLLNDGGKYKLPATMLPMYIQYRYRKDFIVPSIAMAISNKYNKVDPMGNTMIDQMIQWGKTYYFMQQVLPCVPDSVILGYKAQQTAEIKHNLPTIWKHFVDKQLFFSTDPIAIQRYVQERPYTTEIANTCPGRIGRWLGLLIVRQWAESKKLTLSQVMAESNARTIFEQAKFRP